MTGWKSVFGAANTIENGWINELTPYENNIVKEYRESSRYIIIASPQLINHLTVLKIITHNSDIQVRHQWRTKDVAIWDK